MTIAAPPATIASPSRACRESLRFPSRHAAANPASETLAENVTSRPSANDSAAASSQTAAGAANGKRRRASSASTTIAIAGTVNHSVVRGPAGSFLRATSSAASTAAITISTSSP